MGLKQIGQNTTEEFFETLIYMVAYEEATKMIKNFTEDIENPYLREAVESAANVAVFGGIFMIIQYEEQIIEKVFNIANGIISGLLFLPKKAINKLKGLKGNKLKAKFIELAKDKSTGPSGPKGGDLGYFAQGQMVPEFNAKVFSMKVGSFSKPVKTQFGFHVIYLEDKKAGKTRAYTEVKSFIEQRLKMEKFKSSMQEKMIELKNKATIK